MADINRRQTAKFSSLRYFIHRFPCILPKEFIIDDVQDKFRLFQATSIEDKRADEAWTEIGQLATAGRKLFHGLSTVMLGILLIFHSNADCERVFSLVTKNKTKYRASLSTDMLSSLVTRKVMMAAKNSVCHMEDYSDTLLRRAKSSSYEAKLSNDRTL